MKKTWLGLIVGILLASGVGIVPIHAADQCTNIQSDQAYIACCTGQNEFDSVTCQNYAKTEAGTDTQCSNITSDTIYNNCCNGDSGDSAVCKAYATSSAQDDGSSNINSPAMNTTLNPAMGTTKCTSGNCTQTQNQPLNIHLENPLQGISTIPEAVNKILSVVIRIALPIIIVMFIWSGILFIFAQGNDKKLGEAKNIFFYTIIGTLLILGAWTITNAIVGTVNSIIT